MRLSHHFFRQTNYQTGSERPTGQPRRASADGSWIGRGSVPTTSAIKRGSRTIPTGPGNILFVTLIARSSNSVWFFS